MHEAVDITETTLWLKSIFNINRELDFQRMVVSDALQRIEHLEKVLDEYKLLGQSENVDVESHNKTIQNCTEKGGCRRD